MRRVLFFSIALIILIADQLTKSWAIGHLPNGESAPVLAPVLFLTRTTNTGGAFGLLAGATWIMEVTALAAVVLISVMVLRAQKPMSTLYGAALSLPLGGALGNLLDRFRLGYVVDFLDLRLGSYSWPIFNVADSAICVGVVLLAFSLLSQRARESDGKEPSVDPIE